MQAIALLIAGAVLGGWVGDGFGALAGAALAWLGQRSVEQGRRIGALQAAVDALTARSKAHAVTTSGAAAPAAASLPPDIATDTATDSALDTALDTVPVTPSVSASAAAALRGTAAPTSTTAMPPPAPAERGRAMPPNLPAGAPGAVDSLWSEDAHDTEVGSLWGDVAQPTGAKPTASRRPVAGPPPVASRPAAGARHSPASAAADPLAAVRQWIFGGNTIVKLGVAILFIGLAFLAKFATEHVHVPVQLRLAGIACAALVLLVLGWRLRTRRAAYAQVLQGGAVAVLYLTLFAAFRFYGVLAVMPVFVCMVAVAALAAALAVLQNARALAVIGALGGFATPLLLSSGSGNHVALFSYYLVLDLGIAFVAWHRHWRALNLIGFVGTFVVATAWGVLKYSNEHYASSQAFLVAFFLLFTAILLMPVRRQQGAAAPVGADGAHAVGGEPRPGAAWVDASLLFGLPTISFVLQHALVRNTEYGTAFSALAMALFYVAQAAWMRARPQLAITFEASLAMATVFLTLVIPFALDAHSTAGAWALEGAGLVWLGFRQARRLPRLFGYLLLLLAGLAMAHARQQTGAATGILNATLFNGLMAAGASLAAAWFVNRALMTAGASDSESLPDNEAVAAPLLVGWGTLWLLVTAGAQIGDHVPASMGLAAWLVCASAIAALYTALSVRLSWRQITWPAMLHAPFLGLCLLVSAALQDAPSQHGGWWAWPMAIATHLFVLRCATAHWPAWAASVVHTLGALLLAVLGALQGRHITAGWGDANSAWAWLGWLVVPAALLMALTRSGAGQRWPVAADPVAYRTRAGAVLSLGLLVWTLLANVASNGAAQPLPHVPLLNPLDLGVAVAMFAAWLWLRSDAAPPALGTRPALPLQLLALTGFVWLNAMLVRAFHHYGDVPYRFDAWTHSLAVQTGITLLWSVTALALMWWAARRAQRLPWVAGASLLGAVVLKLVLVDLSGSGTVTRIVSFIGVGVLMLVIGYVAPLPAAATTPGDSHAKV